LESKGATQLRFRNRCSPAFCLLATIAWHLPGAALATDGCRPLGYGKAELLELRADDFAIEDPGKRQQFALELIDCLDNPDPVLRDQVAYEGFATLLRGRQLDSDTIRQLRTALLEQLESTDDEPGFRRPFAALVLSELARADRIEPVFTDAERAELVTAACDYMRSIDDYRGFDETEGWRHGVAHDADLLMQLALNPALDRNQLIRIRDAVASQVAPPGMHFYVYGESGRLGRPVLFIAMREEFTDEEWADWFESIASPEPFAAWGEVFSSQAGLAKLHNTRAFLQVIYVNATASDQEALAPLGSASLEALRTLP
jgi:hypothetical protein